MHNLTVLSIARRLNSWIALSAVALASTLSGAQDNTFSGTYNFVAGVASQFSIQVNMFGQQVGFCPNNSGPPPYGYYCISEFGQNVLTGTLIADGKGNIMKGSNYVFTADVNSNACNPKYNPAPDCPYKVPSGIAWSNAASYLVGDEVDFTVNGKLLTFQAVKNNTGVAPNTGTCTSTIQPPNCAWNQLYISATGKPNNKGPLTGTYTVQSNGSAVSQMTLVSPTSSTTLSWAMIVPAAPLAVGQEVPMVSIPSLANEFRSSGAAVRVK